MDVLIYGPYALWKPHFETELEIIDAHLRAGDTVTWLGCDGDLEACEPNPDHRRSRCLKCIGRREAGFRVLAGPVVSKRLADHLTPADAERIAALPDRFEDAAALRALKLDDLDLGTAVLSTLYGMQRDVSLDVVRQQAHIARVVRSAASVHLAIHRYLGQHRPDRVYVFNGRMAVLRPVLRACQRLGIECDVHERGRDTEHYQITRNVMSHAIGPAQERIRAAWASDRHTQEEKDEIAEGWYRARRRGYIGSWYSYTGSQKDEVLPPGWDPAKRNIAIYTTTEYEVAAISDDWLNPVFSNAAEGLQRVIATCLERHPDLHFNLRLHPNSAASGSTSVQQLSALTSPNATVILPDSDVSTYTLMGACEKVLVTGSTVGIEAAYWGKPVILAGRSQWVDLGSVHVATDFDDLLELLADPDLPALDRTGAAQFGYYMATLGVPFEQFEPDGVMGGTWKGTRIDPTFTYRMRSRLARLLAPLRRLVGKV